MTAEKVRELTPRAQRNIAATLNRLRVALITFYAALIF